MKKSQAAVIGFFVVVAFIVIVMTLLSGLFTRMVDDETPNYDLQQEAKFVAEVFNNPGFPENWDSTNVKKIGISEADAVSSAKLQELSDVPYSEMKSKIGGIGKDFIFFFETDSGVIEIDDKQFWGWNTDVYPDLANGGYELEATEGVIVAQAANIAKEEVFVKLDNVEGIVKAVIYTWDEKSTFEWISCGDGFDNDNDGLVDYPEDPGCLDGEDASEADPEDDPDCSDGSDNEPDGYTDYPFDPGCESASDDDESDDFFGQCFNDGDNGDPEDSIGDFPWDPGCMATSGPTELDPTDKPQCSDGIDNNRDGRVDFPEDGGCTSRGDKSERTMPTLPQCANDIDDPVPGEGYTDLYDTDCEFGYMDDEAGPQDISIQCNDGGDNDVNGNVDLFDPGCYGPSDDLEWPIEFVPDCNDGIDNDNDGYTDFPEDSGCKAAGDFSEIKLKKLKYIGECMNGADDNGNGLKDFPMDPCCYSSSDPKEEVGCALPVCYNAFDDDLDTIPDFPWDPGCYAASDPDEKDNQTNPPECSDGRDNDLDGWVDFPWDPGCYAAGDNSEKSPGNPPACAPWKNTTTGVIYNPAVWWPGCLYAGSNITNATGFNFTLAPACGNWTDDDGDNYTDYPWDPGCITPLDNNESDHNNISLRPLCNNSIDDDGDSLIDFPKDPGCAYAADPTENNTWNVPGPMCGNGILESPPEQCETDVDCQFSVPPKGRKCMLCICYNMSWGNIPPPPIQPRDYGNVYEDTAGAAVIDPGHGQDTQIGGNSCTGKRPKKTATADYSGEQCCGTDSDCGAPSDWDCLTAPEGACDDHAGCTKLCFQSAHTGIGYDGCLIGGTIPDDDELLGGAIDPNPGPIDEVSLGVGPAPGDEAIIHAPGIVPNSGGNIMLPNPITVISSERTIYMDVSASVAYNNPADQVIVSFYQPGDILIGSVEIKNNPLIFNGEIPDTRTTIAIVASSFGATGGELIDQIAFEIPGISTDAAVKIFYDNICAVDI